MNQDDNNLDYIDLFLAYLNNELDAKLANDIQQTLENDPVLNATVDGLKKLLDDHQGDKVALKQYFNETQQRLFKKWSKK